jgi:outer membrane receptor protein involved in Fe transport
MQQSRQTKYLLLLLLLCQTMLWTQTTGKIAGIITDKETGEPLMGVNIWIEGSDYGASTGIDGDYFILNVPPGEYDINVEMIGYQPIKVEALRVSVNRTASLSLELSSEAITTETVVVQAERVALKKDQTGTIANVSSKEIAILPVENIDQVIEMQAGVVQGSFRGGRTNEVNYLVDGMSVTESFASSGRAVTIENEVIDELEVIQGTFNAEYGRAMSGVVNTVIKDGSTEFEGSGLAAFSNFYTANTDIFIGLEPSEVTRNQDYRLYLSGPLFSKRITFVANARYQDFQGHLNGIRRYSVDDFNDYARTANDLPPITSATGDGSNVPMGGFKSLSLLSKVTWRINSGMKTSLMATWNDNQWQSYDHGWKYNPDGRPDNYNESFFAAWQFNHMLSNAAFYEIKLSYLDDYYGNYMYENPFDSSYIHPGYNRSDVPGPGFVTGGQDHNHLRRWVTDYNAKFDLTWQITNQHAIKTGVLFTQHIIDNQYAAIQNFYRFDDTKRDSVIIDPQTGEVDFAYFAPDIEYNSVFSDIYKVYPYEFAAYIQDKMEFDEMVFNLGVRLDYFNPNAIYPTDWRNPKNEILNAPESEYVEADAKVQVSPRLGLSYQLGDRAVLHFSYGHFFQMPPLYALYQNRGWFIDPTDYVTTLGNPDLEAQKTVQYEVGLWQEFMPGLNGDVVLFYRDIYELLSTAVISTYNQTQYGLYTNLDYGNAKGLTVKLNYNRDAFTAGLNYTLQYTRGNADNPQQNFTRAGSSSDPITELIPMSWDQRHTLNLTLGYNQPRWGATLTSYYNSGAPYTWEPLETSRVYFVYILPNNSYKPAGFTADLAAYYRWQLAESTGLRLQLNIYNVFDNLNEDFVYARTGRAYTDVILETDRANHVSDFNTIDDRIQNPSMYSAPREIKLGLALEF